jgi:steroid delta-isomerase-like uncharacterized protein
MAPEADILSAADGPSVQKTVVSDVLQDLLAAYNAHDADRVAQICAPNCEIVDVGAAVPVHGREAIRAWCQAYLAAFPDLRIQPDAPIVDGDRGALAYSATGSHRGTVLRIPPTGKVVTIRGAWLVTIRDGQIAHLLAVWDLAGLLRAIGLLPDL